MSEWARVSDELPVNCTQVIASNGDYSAEMYFYNDEFGWPSNSYYPDDYDNEFRLSITHWMLMPQIKMSEL